MKLVQLFPPIVFSKMNTQIYEQAEGKQKRAIPWPVKLHLSGHVSTDCKNSQSHKDKTLCVH